MDFEKKLKEYMAEIDVPRELLPENITATVLDKISERENLTAGVFLKRLKDIKVTGAEFLELLGNSKIGNAEFRRIEENPHLKYEELLHLLDNSSLEAADFQMILEVASQRKIVNQQRKQRELQRAKELEKELMEKGTLELAPIPNKIIKEDKQIAKPVPAESEQKITVKEVSAEELKDTEFSLADDAVIAAAIMRVENILSGDNSANTHLPAQQISEQHSVLENSAVETTNETQPPQQSEPDSNATVLDNNEASTTIQAEATDNEQIQEQETSAESKSLQTADENDDFDLTDEEIPSSAKDIAATISELMANDDDDDDNDGENLYEEKRTTKSSNTGIRITAWICAVILVCTAFAITYLKDNGYIKYNPNSTSQSTEDNNSSDNTDTTKISAYEGIYDQLTAIITANPNADISGNVPQLSVEGSVDYTVNSTDNILDNVAEWENNICYIDQEKVVIVTAENGKMTNTATLQTDKNVIGIFVYKDNLYVVSVNGENEKACTKISVFDLKNLKSTKPTKTYIQGGVYSGAYQNEQYLYLLTKANFTYENAKKSDFSTYTPTFTKGKTEMVIPFSDVVIPDKVKSLSYTVCGGLDLEGNSLNVSAKAFLDGGNGGYSIGANGLFVASCDYNGQSYSTKITKAVLDKGNITISQTADLEGKTSQYTLCQQSDSFYALATMQKAAENSDQQQISSTITIFNSKLETTAKVENIAINALVGEVLLTGNYLSVKTAQETSATYTIDTSATTPALLEKAVVSNSLVKWDETTSLGFSVAADKDGNRTGIKITMYDTADLLNITEKASVTASASSSMSGDWNAYITSDCLSNSKTLLINKEKNIIGVPLIYFDGISQVEEYVFYSYAKEKFTPLGKLSQYDGNYTVKRCIMLDDTIYTLWDNKIISADKSKIKVIQQFEPISVEIPAETTAEETE